MRQTHEKITHHVGTVCGEDISNELMNRTRVVLQEPTHSAAIMAKHQTRVARHQAQEARLSAAREAKCIALEASTAGGDADAAMDLAILENEIKEAAFEATTPLPIKLDKEEKAKSHGDWRTH